MHSIHSPSTRWITNRISSSTLQQRPSHPPRSQTPCLQNFDFSAGGEPAYVSTNSIRRQPQQREHQWQRTYRRRPATLDTQENRQRQKHAHDWQQLTRAEFPGGRFPAKFGYQPIKSELRPLVHAHPANYVRVHFEYLGVYKASRVAYRAIRVRVS